MIKSMLIVSIVMQMIRTNHPNPTIKIKITKTHNQDQAITALVRISNIMKHHRGDKHCDDDASPHGTHGDHRVRKSRRKSGRRSTTSPVDEDNNVDSDKDRTLVDDEIETLLTELLTDHNLHFFNRASFRARF